MSDVVVYDNKSKDKLIDDKKTIRVDFNIIELPLFSKNKKAKPNVGAVYVMSSQKGVTVEVRPGAGLTIPLDFDERVYFALVQICQDYKEKYNFPEIPNIIFTTYYEILIKSGVKRKGNINERIHESLNKLQATQYTLKNCFYNAFNSGKENPINPGEYKASFIHSIETRKVENVLNEKDDFSNYIDPNTKSLEVLKIELNPFFLDNLLHKKGHLRHKVEDMAKLDGAARRIYLYCEKNRWHIGQIEYGTDLKMKISARKLAAIIPYSFINTNVPGTINKLRKTFKFLEEKKLISSYQEIPGKTQADTEYEVCFDWSRAEYLKTGREDHEIINYEEFSSIVPSILEQESYIDYSKAKNFSKVTKSISETLSKEINPILNELIEPIRERISEKTVYLLNEFLSQYGQNYVVGSIQYATEKSTKDFENYLTGTLKKNWAKEYIFKLNQQDKEDEIATQEQQKKIMVQKKKELESEKEKLNASEIEKLYQKLPEDETKKFLSQVEKIKNKNPKFESYCSENEIVLHLFAESINRYYLKNVMSRFKFLKL